MAWLPMYLHGNDLELLCEWLNAEKEIAFLVSNGERKWIAVDRVEKPLIEGKYILWHIPSGPIPVPGKGAASRVLIKDPWSGWQEKRQAPHLSIPFSTSYQHGPVITGHPGVIELKLWPYGLPRERENGKRIVGLSGFGWLGNYYWAIGRTAHPQTKRWWQRLRRWVAKTATRIPMIGPIGHPKPLIYAFTEALRAISEAEKQKARLHPKLPS